MDIRRLLRGVGYLIIRASDLGINAGTRNLKGDREVEWSWAAAQLPDKPGRILDFGCGTSHLPLIGAMKGGDVSGLDLMAVDVPYQRDNLRHLQGDILDFDFGDIKFDVIMNCSSIEHVGLAGRYNSQDSADGDLRAMQRLRSVLAVPNGIMILTLPIGIDSVFPPLHRVYGARRLDQLLKGFSVIKKEFWSKRPGSRSWVGVSEDEALSVEPSRSFYSLGLLVLEAHVSPSDGN